MDSCISLRIIISLYLVITMSHAYILPEEEGGVLNNENNSEFSPTNTGINNGLNNQEDYWKDQLGENAVMPKAVKDSLNTGQQTEMTNTPTSIDEQDVLENDGGRRTMKDATHRRHGHTHVSVGPNDGVVVRSRKHGGGHADVDVGRSKGVRVNAGKNGKGADVQVGHEGVFVNAGSKEKPVYVGVKPGLNPFQYDYTKKHQQQQQSQSQSQSQSQQISTNRALFFLEKDMKPGHSVNLHLTKKFNDATFLPREKANSLPFSSDKLPSILKELSIEPGSEQAKVIEETIKGCERMGIKGEQKYCATSLESLIDFAKKTLGENIKAMSTEAEGIVDELQKYTIDAIKQVTKDREPVVCHKQNYAYAVYYCHRTKGTSAYMISLLNMNGSKAKSMAVCHKDTSNWNPQHLAFEVLNVKPGSVPICHFLPEDHLVWVPY